MIYRIKIQSDGSIEWCFLSCKCYKQKYDFAMKKPLLPWVKWQLFALHFCCYSSRTLYQMNIKNAFLNSLLAEEIYMIPPHGLSHPTHYVCWLHRALYGFEQARTWFERFSNTTLSVGYSLSFHDSTLFYFSIVRRCVFLLYINEMLITGEVHEDEEDMRPFKTFLSLQFDMKDIGPLLHFLGIEVAYFL